MQHMDAIKLFTKNGKEMKTLTPAVRIYIREYIYIYIYIYIVMEKCAMQIMKSEKRQIMEGRELPK